MSISSEHNDINDPVVQDVLNEFRDELLISKNNKDMTTNLQPPPIIHEMPNVGIPNSPNNPPYPHQPQPPPQYHQHSQSQPPYQNTSYPSNPQQNTYSQHSNQQNKNDYMLYIDVELIKKNLIIVIIVFLIYFSGIINNIYDRIPEYLQDNILPLDIYIKTVSLFMILYIISYTGYI